MRLLTSDTPPHLSAAAPRKRSRLADQGRGKKSSAAVVVPSRQIKVADSELLTDWERKRQVGGAGWGIVSE